MKNKNVSTIKPFCSFSYSPNLKQAPGPGKPIIAYPGFNIANRGINFIPRLDFVPESTIKTNLGTNYVLSGCPPKSGPASLGSPVNLPFIFCG